MTGSIRGTATRAPRAVAQHEKCFSTEFASAAERPARQLVGKPRAGGAPAVRWPMQIPGRSTFRVARRRAVLVSRCPLLTRSLGAFLAGAFIKWCLYPGLYFMIGSPSCAHLSHHIWFHFGGAQGCQRRGRSGPGPLLQNVRKIGPRHPLELSGGPPGVVSQRRSSRGNERGRHFDIRGQNEALKL